jgi:hypothetical protein
MFLEVSFSFTGSMVSRARRVVYTLRDLLGGDEIYHYHSKLMMKEPEVNILKH